MMMVVISKDKLKKILITILALIFFISLGMFIFFKDNGKQAVNMINPEENMPYEKGTKLNSNYVALICNIDLGWESEYVEGILDVAKEKNIKMSFNVTGKWAEKNKDLLLRIKEEGHEIGNHGYRHIDYDTISYEENIIEISTAKKIIEDIIKEETKFFQAPSGAFGKETVKAARSLGYTSIKWNIDTIDWNNRKEPEVVFERVKKKEMTENSIILMHPTYATTKCLGDIIDLIREKNLEAGRLSDVF